MPRFEKAYARILNNAKEGGALKWAIFQRALATGLRVSRLLQSGGTPSGLALEYALADKLVFSKLRQRFGGSCASSSRAARRYRKTWPSSFTPPVFFDLGAMA